MRNFQVFTLLSLLTIRRPLPIWTISTICHFWQFWQFLQCWQYWQCSQCSQCVNQSKSWQSKNGSDVHAENHLQYGTCATLQYNSYQAFALVFTWFLNTRFRQIIYFGSQLVLHMLNCKILKSHISAPGAQNSPIFSPSVVYQLYLHVIIDFGHNWGPFISGWK